MTRPVAAFLAGVSVGFLAIGGVLSGLFRRKF